MIKICGLPVPAHGHRARLGAGRACCSHAAVTEQGEPSSAPYLAPGTWLAGVEGLDGFVPMPRSGSA